MKTVDEPEVLCVKWDPQPLRQCGSCGQGYQLYGGDGVTIRPHFANPYRPGIERCPGSGRPPMPPVSARGPSQIIHHLPVGAYLLKCCMRPAAQVPAFDGFTADVAQVTCRGKVPA